MKNKSETQITSDHERKSVFVFEICCKMFTYKTVLKQHIGVHEGKKPYKCDICAYCCSQKGTMNRHVAFVHERKETFKCEICDYSCYQKQGMIIHVESVHEVKSHSNVIFVTTAFL